MRGAPPNHYRAPRRAHYLMMHMFLAIDLISYPLCYLPKVACTPYRFGFVTYDYLPMYLMEATLQYNEWHLDTNNLFT